ncbi:MAG: MOSC N-terminal beta barrel domain-containing protein, partial [Flavitalea sp.]
MLVVSELFIYPIKSLGGIPVHSAKVTDRGLQYDRRWMLVD